MAKNLIPEIAKMLGVELGEEFKFEGDCRTYWFDLDGLHSGYHVARYETDVILRVLLCGDKEVIKLPWKPKKGERYWTFNTFFGSNKWSVTSFVWGDEVFDNAVFKVGWVYRTKAEAEAALPAVAAETGGRL